ncbi:MAG: gluconate 2-dehydrogenase subunit 3 family protein [Solirubrobacterales bacterium]|nr:gluconate 2-dehydrogenase subunit 3 family protein [Solirubrobacterales bacterium]
MAGDFRQPAHLPNLREDRQPAPPDRLPRQRAGVTPQMHGRYPDYNVLHEAPHWDEVTRRLVLDRVENVPEIRFFTASEASTLGAFCDAVLAQDKEPQVPVLNMVDAKLFGGQLDGFCYADMPDDRETWRRVARGLDAAARQHGVDEFATAPWHIQRGVIQAFSEGELHGEVWDELPPKRAWTVVMRAVLSAFYSHPWAWNEIGFGGPAYPRGFARFGVGQREHWEGAAATDIDPVQDVSERGIE